VAVVVGESVVRAGHGRAWDMAHKLQHWNDFRQRYKSPDRAVLPFKVPRFGAMLPVARYLRR